MSLISRVKVLFWDIPLFKEHFMGASIEAWNYVTLCPILASSCFDTVTAMPPSVLLVIGYDLFKVRHTFGFSFLIFMIWVHHMSNWDQPHLSSCLGSCNNWCGPISPRTTSPPYLEPPPHLTSNHLPPYLEPPPHLTSNHLPTLPQTTSQLTNNQLPTLPRTTTPHLTSNHLPTLPRTTSLPYLEPPPHLTSNHLPTYQ